MSIEGRYNMRELGLWGARALFGIAVLGALWPWAVPFYTQAVASLTDALFGALHQPFGAQARAEGVALYWQPLRYTTFDRLQEQMGYVDRFARQSLQGHRLLTIDALYLQAGVLVVVALVWAPLGLSLPQRCRRAALALGVLMACQVLNLTFSAHIEFQLRQRYLSAPGTIVILEDPAWYLYYGLRPVPIMLDYLLPWLVGGALTYKRGVGGRGRVQRSLVPGQG